MFRDDKELLLTRLIAANPSVDPDILTGAVEGFSYSDRSDTLPSEIVSILTDFDYGDNDDNSALGFMLGFIEGSDPDKIWLSLAEEYKNLIDWG